MSSIGEKTMMNTYTAAGLDSEGFSVFVTDLTVMEEASNVDWERKYGNSRVRRRLLVADLSGSPGKGVPMESTTRVLTLLVIPEGGFICLTVCPESRLPCRTLQQNVSCLRTTVRVVVHSIRRPKKKLLLSCSASNESTTCRFMSLRFVD
ncbi:unnamed protein product [Calypogeia fissa]